eukprot:3938407-Rhodomonas_salina.1
MYCSDMRYAPTSSPPPSTSLPAAPSSRPRNRTTPRNPIQEIAISVPFVPGMQFLVFDFGVYDPSVQFAVLTRMRMGRPGKACGSQGVSGSAGTLLCASRTRATRLWLVLGHVAGESPSQSYWNWSQPTLLCASRTSTCTICTRLEHWHSMSGKHNSSWFSLVEEQKPDPGNTSTVENSDS